ncbi:hypothetical protein GW931_00675 [archaeon]|nr:hypothetical protein [archaeon]PJC45178.1 MAG: hypothetical protein CO037_02805 [Candidatus Pacearchaeota archaeon CG_4_9_14_0_2_um_filter_30_8]
MEERRERPQGSGRSFGNGPRRSSGSGSGRFGNNSGGRFGGNRDNFQRREPAEKHKATCSECGQECEVPFKPTQGKPVYCFECFKEKNPRPPRRNFN